MSSTSLPFVFWRQRRSGLEIFFTHMANRFERFIIYAHNIKRLELEDNPSHIIRRSYVQLTDCSWGYVSVNFINARNYNSGDKKVCISFWDFSINIFSFRSAVENNRRWSRRRLVIVQCYCYLLLSNIYVKSVKVPQHWRRSETDPFNKLCN